MLNKTEKELYDEFVTKQIENNGGIRISYSSLMSYVNSPAKFYKERICNDREEESDYKRVGRVAHKLLFENDSFYETYYVMSLELKDGPPKKVVDLLLQSAFNEKNELIIEPILKDNSESILDIIKDNKIYSDRYKDPTLLGYVLNNETSEYFSKKIEFRNSKKVIISKETFERAEKFVDNCKRKEVLDLLSQENDNTIIFNEVEIKINFSNFFTDLTTIPIFYFGILDRVVIDTTKKVVNVFDFKTTTMSQIDYNEKYKKGLEKTQSIIYVQIIKEALLELANEFEKLKDVKNYKINFYYLVSNTNNDIWLINSKINESDIIKTKELCKHYILHLLKGNPLTVHYNLSKYSDEIPLSVCEI
jgi:hypothetical protein